MNFTFSYLSKIILIISVLGICGINSSIGQSKSLQIDIDSLEMVIQDYSYTSGIDTSYARLEYDLSMLYSGIEENELAKKHGLIALKALEVGTELEFNTLNSLGTYYLWMGEYVESLQYFQKAMEFAIKMDDPMKQGVVHYNLYIHYETTSNRTLSILHLKKGYDLMIEAGDTVKTVYLLNAMAVFEKSEGKMDEAEVKIGEALALALEYDDSYLISTTYNNSARFYLARGDTIKTLEYLKKSYAIDLLTGKDGDKSVVTYNIARIYYFSGLTDSSIYYYNLAKTFAEQAHKLNYLERINTTLFELYYEKGNYDTLPSIFKDYQHVTDSILSKENLDEYAEAQNEIELMNNQQELELAQVNQKNSRQQLIMISLVVVLLIIVLIGSVKARNNLQRQKDVSESLYQETKNQKSKIEKQQEELVATNKTLESNAQGKDRIMSLLAHDLRTPFSSIHSLNHLIRVTGDLTEKQLEFLETSNKVIVGGLDLISDILDIYKLEHLDHFELDEINISLLLQNSIEKLTPITTVKGQKLKIDFDDDITFNINREMIQSAVDNLLSNASKYSEKGKEIKLYARKTGSTLTLKICDNGQGFKEEEKAVIFDRFNNFTRTTISTEPSTGLGLFLVKGFVEKLNGTISVESESGKGSTFTLVFNEIKE